MRFRFLLLLSLMFAMLAGLVQPTYAQAKSPLETGFPTDWSHKHVLIAAQTQSEASAKGAAAFAHWARRMQDPRFKAAVAQRTAQLQPGANPFSLAQLNWAFRFGRPADAKGAAVRDWSVSLGTGFGKPNMFPAKYSFNVYATPDCTNDFVVFPTSAAGSNNAATFASATGTFTGTANNNRTVTITRGGTTLTLTSSGTVNTGLFFQTSGNTTIEAQNLASAIQRNGAGVSVTASSSGATVTVTSTVAGAASNAVSLADGVTNFAWSSTTLTGGADASGQPTIVAFNNVYKTTCPGTVPNAFWSFNTGSGSVADLSPVLSMDGTQVAFMQRNASNQASLVVLKWSSGSGTMSLPVQLSSISPAANFRGCTAPCMLVVPFANSANDTYSAPYYDYDTDTLWVGDDSGNLHKFTGVFTGTPTEVTSGGFPAVVSAGNKLGSPVYDANRNLVFVGSHSSGTYTTNCAAHCDPTVAAPNGSLNACSGTCSGGQMHLVKAATGAVTSSGQLATYGINTASTVIDTTSGVRDAPILDSGNDRLYVFVENDVSVVENVAAANYKRCTTNAAAPAAGTMECKAVYQFQPSTFSAGTVGTRVTIGRGQIGRSATAPNYERALYSGQFDQAYYDSGTGTGALYVCGGESTGATSNQPTVWRIPITNNVMGTPVAGPALVGTGTVRVGNCSSITLIKNTSDGNEYLFVSVEQDLDTNFNPTGCTVGTGSCAIYMIKLPAAASWNASVAKISLTATGGTSGVVVDNVSGAAGASQVYYATQGTGTGGNAVQASQAALN